MTKLKKPHRARPIASTGEFKDERGLPYQPSTLSHQSRRDFRAHHRIIVPQLYSIMLQELRAGGLLYFVEFAPNRCECHRPLKPEAFQRVANWVRRRSGAMKRRGLMLAAGVIIPTLDAQAGISFRPFVRMSVQLVVRAPGSDPDQVFERLNQAYGPFTNMKLIEDEAQLRDAIKDMQNRVLEPPIRIRDDVLVSGMSRVQRQAVAKTAKEIREAIRSVGVRRSWVYVGLRADGPSLRLIPSRWTRSEAQNRKVSPMVGASRS